MPDAPVPGAAAPDVFISYAREDRATAQQLADALSAKGLKIWWDREIPGGTDFTEVIAESLERARLVLVLWSEQSVRSSFVRDESARAREAAKLLPLRIAEVQPPLGFGQIQTLDLIEWDGEQDAAAFVAAEREIRRLLGQPAVSVPRARLWLRRRLRPVAMVIGPLLVAVAVGYGGMSWYRNAQANAEFQAGLVKQFEPPQNLESARNHYLTALEHNARHARARYYLAHVYAQLDQPDEARGNFELALAGGRGLDRLQERDAIRQVERLTHQDEPAPVSRPMPPFSSSSVGAILGGIIGAGSGGPPPSGEAGRPEPTPAGAGPARPEKPAQPEGARPTVEPPPAVQEPVAAGQRLRRVAASPEVAARVGPLVEQMFSDKKQERVSATTSLVVDPESLSDAVPLALGRALEEQRKPDPTPGEREVAQSGVVNTLVLLKSATPATLQANREAIEDLLVAARPNGDYTRRLADEVQARLEEGHDRRPLAYIQIADEAQRPLAEALARRLTAAGYDAPGIERVGEKAPARANEIRVQGKSDQGLARWLVKVLGETGAGEARVRTLRNVDAKIDTYEIWLDRDLCVAPDRQVPACGRS